MKNDIALIAGAAGLFYLLSRANLAGELGKAAGSAVVETGVGVASGALETVFAVGQGAGSALGDYVAPAVQAASGYFFATHPVERAVARVFAPAFVASVQGTRNVRLPSGRNIVVGNYYHFLSEKENSVLLLDTSSGKTLEVPI